MLGHTCFHGEVTTGIEVLLSSFSAQSWAKAVLHYLTMFYLGVTKILAFAIS